jgi:glycine cleavage system H protein
MSHASDGRCPIVPPGDLKCVWMSAGILSYQLCEREFDCEHCPLDQAMRMHFGQPDPEAGDVPGTPESSRLEPDRRYSRGHCWVKDVGQGADTSRRVRVGLEPGLARVLPMPRSVVLPSPGVRLARGLPHVWVVAEGGTLALSAPLSGRVVATNPALSERPSRLTSAPLDEGWLYDLDAPQSPQFRGLFDARAAEARYGVEIRRFRAELARALRRTGDRAGPTMADGGVPLADLGQMLGPIRYLEILMRVYG